MSSQAKLTISQWNTQAGRAEVAPVFRAMFNPAKYSRSHKVTYTPDKSLPDGQPQEKRIAPISADTLELDELVLDGTGIVDAPEQLDVDGQIERLKQVLHEPMGQAQVRYAVVEVRWGTMAFLGRLTAMTVNYTLFSADGVPLRARVKLSFDAYEKSGAAVNAGAAAPQTRQLRLGGGDTLPLLCFTAYNDPSLYLAVALFNGLTSIRSLPPGTALTLPKRG